MSRVLLELCVDSVTDAIAAERGGTDRVELNAAYALDGLTPSLGALVEARAHVRLPIIAMLRPRPGGFCYDDAEFRVMQRDADLLLKHGADGLAFGILRPDRTIDADRCRAIVRQCGPRDAVFHRAFDEVPDPLRALEELIDLGFRRVLTSGQQPTATAGTELLHKLSECAAGRIEILPGGGVRPANVQDLVARTGCTQVHTSLRAAAAERLDPSLLAAMINETRR